MTEQIVDVECAGDRTKNCAIRLDNILCDGYLEDKFVGVFSHFHDDHIQSLSDCIGSCDVLLTHPITFQSIVALKPGMEYRSQWVQQDYDTVYKTHDSGIRLLKANHIPGSAQVYVESADKTMLYSGDFSFPHVQIRCADYLVLDPTHGAPQARGKTDRRSVMNRMAEEVVEKTDSHKFVLIKASSGTLQEIVRHFEIGHDTKIDSSVAFAMDEKQERVLRKIYPKEENRFREIVRYDSREFWNMVNARKKCIVFTANRRTDDDLPNFYKIIVDQYEFPHDRASIIPFSDGCRYNLASHASMEEICEYVEQVNPKYVVTDASRGKYASYLAKTLEKKFNIKAEARPRDLHMEKIAEN